MSAAPLAARAGSRWRSRGSRIWRSARAGRCRGARGAAANHAAVGVVGVATNRGPTGPYRGAGRPEAAYLIERMVDLASQETGIDPVELRRRNVVPPDQFPYKPPLGFTYDSGNYAAALDRVCELIDYPRARREQQVARAAGRLRGVGVALYVERAGGQVG